MSWAAMTTSRSTSRIKKGDSSLSNKTGGTKNLTLEANNGDIKLTIGGN